MDLSNKLKQVESGSTVFETTVVRSTNTINSNKLKYTKADRTDLTNRPYGNLFASFNLPITNDEQKLFTDDGVYANTAISGVNVDRVIIVEIPRNEYGELIDGKTILLNIPTTGGTVSCYGTYFNDTSQNVNGANERLSDASPQAGYFGVQPSADNGFNSNITFLFSNSIKPPQYNTGTTWSQWTSANRFDKNNPMGSLTGKQFAVFTEDDNINNNTADEVIGIAYLDKGFFVITNQELVNSFEFSGATSSGFDGIPSGNSYTGGAEFTQIYFTDTNISNASFTSIKTEFIQNVICLAMMDEFYESENPTFLEAYPEGNPNNEPVYITKIGLYNENMELIAIGTTNEPIPKNKFNIVTFNIQLKI